MHFSSFLPLAVICSTAAAANPKRGMISDFNANTATKDGKRFTAPAVTSLSWYYSFGQYQNTEMQKRYEFVMQQFGVNEGPEPDGNNFKNIQKLMSEVDAKRPNVLFTFLEPTGYGVSVDQAVNAWRKYIIPIKKKYPRMQIGSPSMINGGASLPWIREFQQKCPECKFNFLDVHYYWRWNEFQNEINNWRKEFPKKPMYISDIGFQDYNADGSLTGMCQQGDKECVPKIKEMVTWMDNTPWIKRYTFRGEFRRGDKTGLHGWAFLTKDGKFTDLGKWYLGVNK
ncbi:Glycosyl hydrolase catalytic core domain-containing protein 7 [Elsinoe fawcettii]|nr:Glycosyl hydrolase catalytic core domain-containing protein 7 [Elsinoe fawcettii]